MGRVLRVASATWASPEPTAAAGLIVSQLINTTPGPYSSSNPAGSTYPRPWRVAVLVRNAAKPKPAITPGTGEEEPVLTG
ncbi:hypothetical protein GCM10023214_25380 [Amycolatopsis dongchuanensis]|uniref:Uncharacterized protein n=1 Tax=Amycolatopsis dongchuanensis TaxID=1070866 RepID=A0ABP9QFZ3_9PSEU